VSSKYASPSQLRFPRIPRYRARALCVGAELALYACVEARHTNTENNVDTTRLIRSNVTGLLAGVLSTGLWGCASSPTTPQLVDARRAYEDAESSPAKTQAPNELARARVALDRAEEAHDDNPGSTREANLAANAELKAKQAQARAEKRAEHRADVVRHNDHYHAAAPRDEDAPIAAKRASTKSDDRQAAAALQNLSQVANVKQESRGVVITLSGSLLFPSGEEEMSPIARKSLDQVADALAKQPEDSTFEIQGHTDDSGSKEQNEQLAKKRAEAVAEQLVDSGIARDRIRVVGHGETHPIASNDTDEGRASNRRIEIVVDEDNG
jgi:outer membrane protein OmpA-like peptidoglycan-associated protein